MSTPYPSRTVPILQLTSATRGARIRSAELLLLVSTIHSLGVSQSVLVVEFNSNGMIRSTAIKTTALYTGNIRHDLKLSVQTAAASTAEPVLIDLAAGTLGIVGFR